MKNKEDVKIKGICPGCSLAYDLTISSGDYINRIKHDDPGALRFLKKMDGDDWVAIKILDHGAHLLVLEINNEEVLTTSLVVDKLKAGMDTLVNENVNACRAIDSMLKINPLDYKPRVLFLSNLDYFLRFVQSQLSLMVLCGDEFDFQRRRHFLTLIYDRFVYSVSKLEHSKGLLEDNFSTDEIIKLRSLVIDTSVYENDLVLKYFIKWNINLENVKIILAYNSDTVSNLDSQFDLRSTLYKTFKAETVSIIDIVNVKSRRFINLEAIIAVTLNEFEAKSYLRTHVADFISEIIY